MILERSKNAKRNGLWGLISNLCSVLFPFALRTVIIHEMGTEYLGLSGLFTSILNLMSISELGIVTSIVFGMYQALADDDTDLLCSLLGYYRKIYHVLGTVVLLAGAAVMPFLHLFIREDIPADINLYLLYALYVVNAAAAYFLFAYKACILTVYQRGDIKSKFTLGLSAAMYVAQIAVIITTHNYYWYVVVLVLYTLANNLLPALYVKKHYPQYISRGDLDSARRGDIRKRVAGLLATNMSTISRNAFDSITVSAFFGLTAVAVYNNYQYIISALAGMMLVITRSISAGIGNSVASDPKEKNLQDMHMINFWYMWISAWFAACLLCLYQPFMRLWTGTELMLPTHTMALFAASFFVQKLSDIQAQYFDALGLWWQKKYYSIAEAALNIVLNVVLGYFFGIAGIVASTIITVFTVNFLGASRIVFRQYFGTGFQGYLRRQLRYTAVALVAAAVTGAVCLVIHWDTPGISDFSALCIRAVICLVVPNAILLLFYYRTRIFREAYAWLKIRIRW